MKTIAAILALAAMPVLAAELPRAPTPGTVTQMETAGWLQADRSLQILDTTIQPAERYTP